MSEKMKRAVYSGLEHFAPKQSVEVLVSVLEQDYSIDIRSLSDEPGKLRGALTEMFGSGERIVETRISQALARAVGIEYDGCSFEALVLQLKSTNGFHYQA